MKRLKTTKGGVQSMCKVMEDLFASEKREYEEELARLKAALEANSR